MADQPATTAPKKKRTLLFTILALVILGGAGGGGFWWWKHGARAEGAPHKVEKEATGILALDPFVVNLADKDASRFLRATIKLVVEDEHVAETIEKHAVQKSRVRSVILEALSAQESSRLVTPDGKAELKKIVAEKATAVLHTEVRDVLFTDFVVQF
jgi:flagellar FliL protein